MTATATPPAPAANDPWAEADTATWDPTFTVFGQCDIAIRYVVLQKGIGKVDFDPSQHEVGERRVSIEISIVPVIPGRQNVERDMLAQSREWANIVNPSIKAFGPQWNAQMLKGRYVEAQLVPSGRKYTHRESGEQRDATTIKFVRVFASEDECATAALNRQGRNGAAAPAPAAAPAAEAPANDHERATAAKFLDPLWKSCNGDVSTFEGLLKANPLTARYFDLSSPEVQALVGGAEKLPF